MSQTIKLQRKHLLKELSLAFVLIGLALAATPSLARKPVNPAPEEKLQTAQAAPTIQSDDSACFGQVSSPSKLHLPIGKSTLIKLPEPLTSRTVGNQEVLQAKMISPQTLYLLGMDIGATNMIIQSKSGACTIIDVTVGIDPDGLQQSLSELLPEEKNIKVVAAADSVVLTGTVEDAISANRAVDIAAAYVRRILMPVQRGAEQANNNTQQGNQQNRNSSRNQDTVNPRVINMLSVSAQQQVMLEVKVAEVSKSLLDKLGASVSLSQTSGGWTYSLLTDFLSTTGSATGGAIGGFKNSGKNFSLDAEKKDGLVKILAEPSIMAISGQEGSFLAGGRIFIPVAQNNNGGGSTITLEEKEFGVGVKFTPTVLAGGRINLKVAPEVSELNKDGVGITATGFSGTAILPSFTSRKASTTVQLLDGQSFAIGGLIKNNTTANIKAFPILGEIPIIGALFRSTDFQNDKTELVFVVTPHLVKPLPPKGYELPTDRHVDPSRTDLFLKGKLEGSSKPVAPDTKDNKGDKSMVKPEDSNPDAGFDLR